MMTAGEPPLYCTPRISAHSANAVRRLRIANFGLDDISLAIATLDTRLTGS